MRRFLEICVVVGLVVTACSGGGAATTSVASPEATTSSTTLPVTTSTTMPDTTTTATTAAVTTTTGPPVGVAWSRVPHDEAVFGGPGELLMSSVTAGGPGLVAVGWVGEFLRVADQGAVWTSTDGRVWSRVPHDEAVFGGPGHQWMESVTAGGPGLVAVGYDARNIHVTGLPSDSVAAVWTSTDGGVWSRVPHDEVVFGGPGVQVMSSVTAGGPGLVAVGYDWPGGDAGDWVAAVWTSTDGRVWSRVPHDEAVFGGLSEQLMSGVTIGGPGLVAVGQARHDQSDDADWVDWVAAVWTSTDGRVWSRVPHDESVFGGPDNQSMRSVTAGGPGLVAVGASSDAGGSDAAVWTSTDGRVWSRVPHDRAVFGDKSMRSVAAGAPGLVAVGQAPSSGSESVAAVWTSTDGRVWSRVPHDRAVFGGPSVQSMLGVAAGGPGLVAVGYDLSEAVGGFRAAVWVSPPMR
jgi:hypothetical protein